MPYYARTEQPPQVTRTYRAALYIRLSREDGDKSESDSVVNQKRLLTNFVNKLLTILNYLYLRFHGFIIFILFLNVKRLKKRCFMLIKR